METAGATTKCSVKYTMAANFSLRSGVCHLLKALQAFLLLIMVLEQTAVLLHYHNQCCQHEKRLKEKITIPVQTIKKKWNVLHDHNALCARLEFLAMQRFRSACTEARVHALSHVLGKTVVPPFQAPGS